MALFERQAPSQALENQKETVLCSYSPNDLHNNMRPYNYHIMIIPSLIFCQVLLSTLFDFCNGVEVIHSLSTCG